MRELVIGNGDILLCLDGDLCLRDFYYPRVGLYNHAGGRARLGVWVEEQFEWVTRPAWQIRPGYAPGSLVTESAAQSDSLGVRLRLREAIHYRENLYLRRITVRNLLDQPREIRIFFAADFSIQETPFGDTVFMDPFSQSVIHYKRGTYFLVAGGWREGGIAQFATGLKGLGHMEGTWRDAEDGHLQGNPIAHGSVDSTVAFHLMVDGDAEETLDTWVAVGESLEAVRRAHEIVRERGVGRLLDDTESYWRFWVRRVPRAEANRAFVAPAEEPAAGGGPLDFGDLPSEIADLFYRSLLVVRTQIDNGGAVIASGDSEHLQAHKDTYQHMSPRAGALAACALDRVGCGEVTRKFFQFCAGVLSENGYLWHKYFPDGSLGASWLPWILNGQVQTPIQADQTALVLYALWRHYLCHRDIEFTEVLYQRLVRPAANFLDEYRDPRTGLPLPCWDVWEEQHGIFAFTAAAASAGLVAAASFARELDDSTEAARYARGAVELRRAIEAHFYDEEAGRFVRRVAWREDGSLEHDRTLDSSLFGLVAFGTLPAQDARVLRTMEAVRDGLRVPTEIGGIARYAGDESARQTEEPGIIPGNPWFLTTLWLSQWQIVRAQNFEELHAARAGLDWAWRHATRAGLMAEQVHPFTGYPLSACPHTASHTAFLLTVLEYLDKLAELRRHGKPGNGKGTPEPARVTSPRPF
jgi:GH15 family glucan-1,4-alpha-glucosidase